MTQWIGDLFAPEMRMKRPRSCLRPSRRTSCSPTTLMPMAKPFRFDALRTAVASLIG
jgi:hypothetical protein